MKKQIGQDTFDKINNYIENNIDRKIDVLSWYKELESREGLIGVPFESDIDVIKELVKKYNEFQAYQKQCYPVSKEVMQNIIRLLKTDGINSKKEVIGILETYILQEE